ncbi:MAG: SDR family NAD(P)-dependent oxidoreductase [Polyangiaceae bacterium]
MSRPIAVVTGAGRGLGALVAARLAARDHAVCCTDVDLPAAEATAHRIGAGAFAIEQDVREPASHRRVAVAATERGTVKVWVNNAGVLRLGAAWEQDDATVEQMLSVNLGGVVHGSRAAVGAMRDLGGVLVNVASMSSLVPAPGLAVYGATKHAVLGFSTGLEGDLRRARIPIRVCAICPDAMETDMVKGVADQDESDLLYASLRMLRPEEAADAIAELVERPRLLSVLPRSRGLLAHALQPFPAASLRILELFGGIGRRVRRSRGLTRS